MTPRETRISSLVLKLLCKLYTSPACYLLAFSPLISSPLSCLPCMHWGSRCPAPLSTGHQEYRAREHWLAADVCPSLPLCWTQHPRPSSLRWSCDHTHHTDREGESPDDCMRVWLLPPGAGGKPRVWVQDHTSHHPPPPQRSSLQVHCIFSCCLC